MVRKGLCANHIHDVSKLLHGAHVTVNARNEDEVDEKIIIEKVAKSTGSSYSFKSRVEPEKAAPVVFKQLMSTNRSYSRFFFREQNTTNQIQPRKSMRLRGTNSGRRKKRRRKSGKLTKK